MQESDVRMWKDELNRSDVLMTEGDTVSIDNRVYLITLVHDTNEYKFPREELKKVKEPPFWVQLNNKHKGKRR